MIANYTIRTSKLFAILKDTSSEPSKSIANNIKEVVENLLLNDLFFTQRLFFYDCNDELFEILHLNDEYFVVPAPNVLSKILGADYIKSAVVRTDYDLNIEFDHGYGSAVNKWKFDALFLDEIVSVDIKVGSFITISFSLFDNDFYMSLSSDFYFLLNYHFSKHPPSDKEFGVMMIHELIEIVLLVFSNQPKNFINWINKIKKRLFEEGQNDLAKKFRSLLSIGEY